jgi:PAS domain S-box-containing protein
MKKPRVLNLDDNVAARYLRSRSLAVEGFDVIEAGTGAEALRIVREQKLDIALLDVKLPDMSGLEVCSLIKSDPATSELPVVQISATHITDDDKAAGIEHGADIYLTEPTEAIVLVTVIRTLLRLRQSESRLLASEQRFRAIVNQATAGIVQTDLAGVILHANERYCDFVGRPVEELPGVSLFAVTHPEDVEQCRMLFNRLVTNGAPFDTDMRYLRQDGRIVWTSNSLSVVRDKNGVAQHAIAIVIDITERKRGEEREHFGGPRGTHRPDEHAAEGDQRGRACDRGLVRGRPGRHGRHAQADRELQHRPAEGGLAAPARRRAGRH